MEQEELFRLIRNPELLIGETLPQLKDIIEISPLFQTGWMLLLRNLKNINSFEFGDYLKKAAPRVSDRRQLFQYLHPEQFPVKTGKSGRLQKNGISSQGFDFDMLSDSEEIENYENEQTGMIDNFLKNQPAIKIHPSSDPGNKIDLSERSASEHDDFLTETLAEIYVRQNNLSKAIESFEKLSLKYPGKSIYFAARIEEIKKLLNN